MLSDLRQWLETELAVLANASHNPYAVGQANMAKRVIERLDEEFRGRVIVPLERRGVDAILTALERLSERDTSLDPALDALRNELQTAIAEE